MPFKDGTGPAAKFRCFGQAQGGHGWRRRSFSDISTGSSADSAEAEFLEKEIANLESKLAALKKRHELLKSQEAAVK